MATVPGIYLDGARDPHNLFLFIDPTKEIAGHDYWCYWSSLMPSGGYDTAATYGSDRIRLSELIHPCNTLEEALDYFHLHYPEYRI